MSEGKSPQRRARYRFDISHDVVESLHDSATMDFIYEGCADYEEDIESYLGRYDYGQSKEFISTPQKVVILMLIASCILFLFYFPEIAISAFFFSGTVLHLFLIITKYQLFLFKDKTINLRSNYIEQTFNSYQKKYSHLQNLPIYSILLPVFKEEKSVIEQLFAAINNLDYPKDRLQVLLILESCDKDTILAAETIQTNLRYDRIIVPDFKPRTKAKACNYALNFVTGEYVVVFDADDIPAPDQLHIALSKFKDNPHLTCLQAKLNYYNADENLLTRLFSVEYSILFDKILPALASRSYPLPLGGTSNHFKMEALRDLRGWDIYNLTEDAEIGMRLATHGYKTGVIDSYTAEESPITAWAWIKQRTRWLKGFIQTYLLYLQNIHNFTDKVGYNKSLISFHFMIGLSTLSLLITPMLFLLGCFGMQSSYYEIEISLAGAAASTWLLTTVHQTWSVMRKSPFLQNISRFKKMVVIVAFFPYFILHTIAAFYAVFDLIVRPFYWSRTKHGVTNKKFELKNGVKA